MYLYTYGRICAWKLLSHHILKKGEDQHLPPLLPHRISLLDQPVSPGEHSPTYYPIKQLFIPYQVSPFGIRMSENSPRPPLRTSSHSSLRTPKR